MSAVHEGWCFAVLLSVVVFLFPLALSLPSLSFSSKYYMNQYT